MKAHLEAAPNSVDPLAVLEVALQARLLHVDHVINRCVLVNLSNLLATEMDAHLLDLNLANYTPRRMAIFLLHHGPVLGQPKRKIATGAPSTK